MPTIGDPTTQPANTPRMSTVLADLQTRLLAIYVDPATPLTFGFGDLTPTAAPPRITWMPGDARHGPSEATTGRNQPRRILTRIPLMIAHCWGVTYDATEQLVHDLLNALYAGYYGSVDFQGEQWNTGNNADLGCAALVTFAIHVPVERRKLRTTTFSTFQFDATGAQPGDGEIEAGEP